MPQNLIPIFSAGSIGVITDFSDHTIPPEAWTSAMNVRFADNKAFRSPGYVSALGTPSVKPAFLLPVEFGGVANWMYPNQATGGTGKVFVANALGQFDITRASGGYTSNNGYEWNGLVFQGVPILNNGTDKPQYWSTINTGTKLQDLDNWPDNVRAKVLAPYSNFIIAMNLTVDGVNLPHRIRWSDGAAPGTLPLSWDPTVLTSDSDDRDLSDTNAGDIIGGLPFQGYFTIYKKNSTWMLRYIGGQLIMSIDPVMNGSGLLTSRALCNVTLPLQKTEVHFLMNGWDVGIFDGNGFESVVHKKVLRQIEAELDNVTYQNAYCFNNPTKEEAVFAYPTGGSLIPNRALVWNYRDNTCNLRDWFGYHSAIGTIDSTETSTWQDFGTATWASLGIKTWRSSRRQQVLTANNQIPKFYALDTGFTADGTTYPSSLERTGLAIVGQDRTGQPVVDFEQRKTLLEIWPKIRGGQVNVYAGAAESFDGPYDWSGPVLFDPNDDFPYVDFDPVPEGRLLAVRFEGVGNDPWVMDGYSVKIATTGKY